MSDDITTLGSVTKTSRHFEVIEFRDINDGRCTLQQSSLAEYEPPGTSAVWLGIGEVRMHLSLVQVRALVRHLERWCEAGTFVLPEGER